MFEERAKQLSDQLYDLLQEAKKAALLEFQNERSNWEKAAREYDATICDLDTQVEQLKQELTEAYLKYDTLRAKLSDLV